MEPLEPERPVFAPAPLPRTRRTAFGAGDIFSRTFGVWFSRLPAFLLLTIVLFLPLFVGYALLALGDSSLLPDEEQVRREGWQAALAPVALYTAVFDVLGTVLASAAAAAFAYTVIKRLQRQPAAHGASVAMGFSRLPAVLGVALVVGLAAGALKMPARLLAPGNVAVGLLFTIASMVVSIIWSTAVPAAVVERLGVAAALGRSAALTRGYRLRIFWAVVLVVFTLAIAFVVVDAALGGDLRASPDSTQTWRVRVIVWGVLTVIVASLQAVASTVVYHGLRDAKEGLSADDLVKAFE